MFHIGQRVVCIDDSFHASWYEPWNGTTVLPILPQKGMIYTVRWCAPFLFESGERIGILLNEIVNPEIVFIPPPDRQRKVFEHPLAARRFRPVKETDISVFTAMLEPANWKVRA